MMKRSGKGAAEIAEATGKMTAQRASQASRFNNVAKFAGEDAANAAQVASENKGFLGLRTNGQEKAIQEAQARADASQEALQNLRNGQKYNANAEVDRMVNGNASADQLSLQERLELKKQGYYNNRSVGQKNTGYKNWEQSLQQPKVETPSGAPKTEAPKVETPEPPKITATETTTQSQQQMTAPAPSEANKEGSWWSRQGTGTKTAIIGAGVLGGTGLGVMGMSSRNNG